MTKSSNNASYSDQPNESLTFEQMLEQLQQASDVNRSSKRTAPISKKQIESGLNENFNAIEVVLQMLLPPNQLGRSIEVAETLLKDLRTEMAYSKLSVAQVAASIIAMLHMLKSNFVIQHQHEQWAVIERFVHDWLKEERNLDQNL